MTRPWRWAQARWNEVREDHRRPVPLHIRSGRRPFQRFVMGVGVLQGLLGVFGDRSYRSPSIATVLTPGAALTWYAASGITCAVVLVVTMPKERPVNMLDPRARDGLRRLLQYEALGLTGMGCTSLGFSAAVLANSGAAGSQVALTFGAFLGAVIARLIEIIVDLRKMRYVEAHPRVLAAPVLADPSVLADPGGT